MDRGPSLHRLNRHVARVLRILPGLPGRLLRPPRRPRRPLHRESIITAGEQALGRGLKSIPWHTDHHRADLIAWQCIEPPPVGGLTLLCDGIAAIEDLKAEARETLGAVMLQEHQVFRDDEGVHPLLTTVDGHTRLYCSLWLAGQCHFDATQRQALEAFQRAIEAREAHGMQWQEGDVLVIDNRRMLHGRSAIEGHHRLERYWLAATRS